MSSLWELCPTSKLETVPFLGHQVTVHRAIVPALRVVELRALRTEYGSAFAAGQIGPTPTGAFACRNRRPYPEQPVTWAMHSEHAHGTAIDVDYDSNPLRSDGVLVTNFDRFGLEDGRDWLAAWLEPPPGLPVFFRWGGGWTTDPDQAAMNLAHNGQRIRSGIVDGMHFEIALGPGEVAAYEWTTAIEREEAMNKRIERAVEFVDTLRDRLRPGKDKATAAGAARRVAEATKWVERRRAEKEPEGTT